MRHAAPVLLALLASCSASESTAVPEGESGPGEGQSLVCGARLLGGEAVDLQLEGATIDAIWPSGEGPPCEGPESVDAEGLWLSPAFIDSHVHLAYYEVHAELADAGVAAAVDLAAPLDTMGRASDLRVLESGPMITAPGGYPTQGWGAGGYGWEVADTQQALDAVAALHERGATLVKLPLHGDPALDEDTAAAVVEKAHELGLRVAVHALSDDDALLGAQLGADVLAHTPVQPLSEATLEAWRGRAVVSTLAAFGASDTAKQNLAALRERNVVVLYGTDLGNSRDVGIQSSEVAALLAAGLDARSIVEAGTSTAADFWQLPGLGTLEPGASASFLLVREDPYVDPTTLSEPVAVMLDGQWRASGPPLAGGLELLPNAGD